MVVARNGFRWVPGLIFGPGSEVRRWDFIDDEDSCEGAEHARQAALDGPAADRPRAGSGFVYLRFDEFDGKDRRWLSRQLQAHAQPGNRHRPALQSPWRTFSLGIVIGEFLTPPWTAVPSSTRAGSRT